MMRFAITALATGSASPTNSTSSTSPTSSVPPVPPSVPRTLLTDLRTLRAQLDRLPPPPGPTGRELARKGPVMHASVEKVERALYGWTVRGAERPGGWVEEGGGEE